MGIWLLV